jgi:hypothetical protein
MNITRAQDTNLPQGDFTLPIYEDQGRDPSYTKPGRGLSPYLAHHIEPNYRDFPV